MPSRNDSNTTCTSHSNPQLDSNSSSSISVSRTLSTVTSSATIVAYGAAVIIASGAVIIGGAYYWQYYWKHQHQHQRRRHDNDNGFTDGDDDDNDEVERLKDEIARLQNALKKVARHYHHGDSVSDDYIPDVLSTSPLSSLSSAVLSLHSTETPIEWRRCMLALTQFESGYQRRQRLNGTKKKKASGISRTPSQKRQEKTGGSSILLSKFVPSTAATHHKATVCALLVARTLQHLPYLVADLQKDPHLILVILEAPNCGTSRALCAALPSLPHTRICVPQADPTHFLAMTTRNDNSSGGSMLLNLRAQRLDQWLVANAHGQWKVALFFADYETSIYGKPAVAFSPLRDIQGFFRLGYAAATSSTGAQQHQTTPHQCCLFGITLSFRPPHPSQCVTLDEYTLLDTDNNSTIAADSTTEWVEDDAVPVGPRLTPADLVGFIAAEAAAVGLRSTLIETHHYGMSFFLFLVEPQQQPTNNKQKQQQNNRV